MNEDKKPLTGSRIGLFGKGGSGKSTTIVLLAKMLRDHGYEVCIVDADSTNIGLYEALGLEASPDQLMEYFGGMVFGGGNVTCPVDDPTPLPDAKISLEQLPGRYYGQTGEGICLLTAGKIGDQGPGAGCDGPVSKIARDLKIQRNGEAPVTLIDFKAGFEDSARGAVTSLDWALVIVDPTTAAIVMAVSMRDLVDQIQAGWLPATKHLETPEAVWWANHIFSEATIKGVLVVLNRVGDAEMEGIMRKRLAEEGIEPVGVIHEDPAIAMSWLKGTPLVGEHDKEALEAIVQSLELAQRAQNLQIE